MGLSLGDLFTSGLLFLNAIAVLHEERFLAKRDEPSLLNIFLGHLAYPVRRRAAVCCETDLLALSCFWP